MPHSTYMPERMGHATIEPTGSFEAGSFQSFTLVYTAGYFGIDDTGSLKIVMRFASDMAKPQFTDPAAPNYTTIEASNGAVLEFVFDNKRNIRPWDKTLFIRVMRGFLREDETITIRFGDRRKGSPGIRVQTFVEPSFEFKVLADPFATYDYVELPRSPEIAIVAGPPAIWNAILPTQRLVGESFRLGIKADDRWGNPSDRCDATLHLKANRKIRGLPDTLRIKPGELCPVIDGLIVEEPGDVSIEIRDASGALLCQSNPLRVLRAAPLVPYWGDLHGQSEETIGTNSARELILFARDRAFLDVMSHQGNDFQITTPFWNDLNRLTAEYNKDGSFIIFPGYEWSGNTGLGGDRNVMFMNEGRQIHRSSHALVDDHADLASDANAATDLFDALKGEDCVVFAHIGGRYADIKMAHDVRIERAVEVHSDWGTFEWLVEDAFEQGYRIGILANSDGHKGRHGASYPGASLFGAYGGLSCILAKELTRQDIFDALRRRHHYATTGSRLILDTRVRFDRPAKLYAADPNLAGPNLGTTTSQATEAMMGDIVQSDETEVTFEVECVAGAPIERLELRNGLDLVHRERPYGPADLGSRIRIIWEGSEYRGRGRHTVWDGHATLAGNRFQRIRPINLHNLDKKCDLVDGGRVEWTALTTGGFGGFDAWLDEPRAGTLKIETPLVRQEVALANIGLDDLVFTAGGIRRQMRIFRLPTTNTQQRIKLTRRIKLKPGRDNPLYVCVTTEDGHQAWSSPVYVIAG